MSGECEKCGEHALECGCSYDFDKAPDDSIEVYITMNTFYKLSHYVDFYPTHLYDVSDLPMQQELGKIGILGGPTLRFYLKRHEPT